MPREEKMLQLAYLIYYEKMLQPNRLTSIKIILDHASCYFFLTNSYHQNDCQMSCDEGGWG